MPGDGLDAGLGQRHAPHPVAEIAAEVDRLGQHQPGGGLGGLQAGGGHGRLERRGGGPATFFAELLP
ncbi:hypothetical protein [Nonomuraea wenchangensis]|uniref:hypothetical protein n=1 Tax=Nonomuraea wenchangensis TaxID=568860 RepID=UPI000B89CE72|nr:hypothetical protein [Nonomuraea wenchangensis]